MKNTLARLGTLEVPTVPSLTLEGKLETDMIPVVSDMPKLDCENTAQNTYFLSRKRKIQGRRRRLEGPPRAPIRAKRVARSAVALHTD